MKVDDLRKYLSLEETRPGILELFEKIVDASAFVKQYCNKRKNVVVYETPSLFIEVSKPWIDQCENSECLIRNHGFDQFIELKMDSNSLSKLSEKTENEIFKALQKASLGAY